MVVGGVAGGITARVRTPVYRSAVVFRAQQGREVQGGARTNAQFLADLLISDTVLRRVANSAAPGDGRVSVDGLRRAIKVDVNLRTGVVRFTVDARTPQLAQALAESALADLGDANTAMRQTRAQQQRIFIAQRTAHALEELQAAEQALRAASRGSDAAKQTRLTLAAHVAQQIYVQLRVAEELAVAREARDAPTIEVIESPQLPVRPDRPRLRFAVLLGLVIGASLALVRFALES
jgi:uncharacterized protein involved in exopolysaccharide biosynthesis